MNGTRDAGKGGDRGNQHAPRSQQVTLPNLDDLGITRDESSKRPEIVTIPEAAAWLRCSHRTIERWIMQKRFTPADGLRHVGDLVRIHFPTLQTRFKSGKLMTQV